MRDLSQVLKIVAGVDPLAAELGMVKVKLDGIVEGIEVISSGELEGGGNSGSVCVGDVVGL